MDGQLRLFKDCMASSLQLFDVKFSEFTADRDYRSFVIDQSISPCHAKELAAKALCELCRGDGDSMDRAVCVCVTIFLDKACGYTSARGQDEKQRLRDLAKIIQDQASTDGDVRYRQYLGWASSWY